MDGKKGNPELWFALGYLTALSMMFFTDWVVKYLRSLEVPATVTPIHSDNGKASVTGETVTSLVKEEATSE